MWKTQRNNLLCSYLDAYENQKKHIERVLSAKDTTKSTTPPYYPKFLKLKVCKYHMEEEKDKCRERHIKNNEEDKKDDNNKPGNVIRGRLGRFRGLRIPMRFQHQEVKSKRVDRDFITNIDIPYDENIEKNKGHTITVRFDHIEGSWKHGWMIDTFILEKII